MDLLIDQQEMTKWLKVNVHSIKITAPAHPQIYFSNGKINLLRYVHALKNSETFEKFLRGVVNVNVSLPNDSVLWPGCTPLHLAVMYSYNLKHENKAIELVDLCLKKGASIHIQDQLNATPLHLAFKLELHQVVSFLLRFIRKSEKSEKIENLVDNDNLSYLHIALADKVDRQNCLARQLLSDVRSDIETSINVAYKGKVLDKLKSGWTPLHVAVDQRHYDFIELLVEKGASEICKIAQSLNAIEEYFGRALTNPFKHLILSSQPLRNCVLARDIGLEDLHVAVWLNDIKSVNRLLDEDANIEATVNPLYSRRLENFRGSTPLHMAVVMNHCEIVDVLLRRGADIYSTDAQGSTVIHKLFCTHRESHKSVANLLFASKQLEDRSHSITGLTYLHVAVYLNNDKAVERLLKNGANIEATIKDTLNGKQIENNFLSCTPLHVAMIENHLKIAKILIKRGANVNASINDYLNSWRRNTMLHILMSTCSGWRGNTEKAIFEKILQTGCDIDGVDRDGRTVLHLVFKKKRLIHPIAILNVLLSAGIDINIEDRYGKSALSYLSKRRGSGMKTDSIEILGTIIYKMQLIGVEVSELNETLRTTEQFGIQIKDENAFYDQVEETDKIIIGHRGLTLRSFLFETGAINLYPSLTPTDRREIDDFFETFTYNDSLDWKFLLKLQHRKLTARLSLVAPAGNALKHFIDPRFPDLCVDMILKYLSNSALKKLIAASQLTD